MSTRVGPPSQDQSSFFWSTSAAVLAIFVAGVGLLVGGIIWLSSGSPDGPAAPVVSPAVAAPAAAASGMAGMAGMAGSSSAASGAKATSAPHVPFDAALPPVGAGTQHHYTIRLNDEASRSRQVSPTRVRASRALARSRDSCPSGRLGRRHTGERRNDPAFDRFHAALIAPDVSFATVPAAGACTSASAPDCGGVHVPLRHPARPRPYRQRHVRRDRRRSQEGLPPVAKSFVLVSGEWYSKATERRNPRRSTSKRPAEQPDYVTFNGYANQYKEIRSRPIQANRPLLRRRRRPEPQHRLPRRRCNARSRVPRRHRHQRVPRRADPSRARRRGHGLRREVPRPGIFPFVSHAFAAVEWAKSASSTSGTSPAP